MYSMGCRRVNLVLTIGYWSKLPGEWRCWRCSRGARRTCEESSNLAWREPSLLRELGVICCHRMTSRLLLTTTCSHRSSQCLPRLDTGPHHSPRDQAKSHPAYRMVPALPRRHGGCPQRITSGRALRLASFLDRLAIAPTRDVRRIRLHERHRDSSWTLACRSTLG